MAGIYIITSFCRVMNGQSMVRLVAIVLAIHLPFVSSAMLQQLPCMHRQSDCFVHRHVFALTLCHIACCGPNSVDNFAHCLAWCGLAICITANGANRSSENTLHCQDNVVYTRILLSSWRREYPCFCILMRLWGFSWERDLMKSTISVVLTP